MLSSGAESARSVPNSDPLLLPLVIGFLILSLGIHEAAHAWVAHLRGDDTAKNLGRMTLNPIVHIDPIMTVLLPAVLFYMGGLVFAAAKPVPVAYNRLRSPLRDMMLVAIAGPLANLLLAFVFAFGQKALIHWGGMHPDALGPQVLRWSGYVNVILAVFNMLPVPPLDGSRVMAWLLPSGIRETYVELERFGLLIVFGLLYLGLGRMIAPLATDIYIQIHMWTGGVNW